MIVRTYVINLAKRMDRRTHVLKQFENKPEFAVNVVPAIEHQNGALGLWQTIRSIVNQAKHQNDDFILVCEDDHEFTEHYDKEVFLDCIVDAINNRADILLGGVSMVRTALQVTSSLLWTETFNGTQFLIIFKKFYENLLSANFQEGETADFKISGLTKKVYFIYPFISVQRDFGYSDATLANNLEGHVADLFSRNKIIIQHLLNVTEFYRTNSVNFEAELAPDFNYLQIPVYIINLPERTDRLFHVKAQFEGRFEFEVKVIPAYKHEIGAVGLWLTMRIMVDDA